MNFEISITDQIFIEDEEKNIRSAVGRIKLNTFEEKILLPLEFWSPAKYKEQWIEALELILDDNTKKSTLITEMYDPESFESIAVTTWPMYKVGEKVIIQNVWVPYKEFSQPFNYYEIYKLMDDRETDNIMEDRPSEWEISLDDVKDFLNRLKSE